MVGEEQITFAEIVFKCAENRVLVAEFDRLTGSNLSMTGSGLDRMIDGACNRYANEVPAFVAFVHEFIWLPLVERDERGD